MLLALFCKQNIKHKHTHTQHSLTHSCLPLPTHSLPFQQTIYLFQQIENEVFRCFQLVYLFFSFFTSIVRECVCVCVCVSLSLKQTHHTHTQTHTHSNTNFGKRRERGREYRMHRQPILRNIPSSVESTLCFSLCLLRNNNIQREREKEKADWAHTLTSPPHFSPLQRHTCGTRGGGTSWNERERGGGETRLSQEQWGEGTTPRGPDQGFYRSKRTTQTKIPD